MRRFLLVMMVGMLLPALAVAHSTQSGAIKIGHVWADIATQQNGGINIYLPIFNGGKADETLTKVTTPLEGVIVLVVPATGDQDAERREPVNLVLPAGKPINLAAHGMMLRLEGADKIFQAGDKIPLTFHFAATSPAQIDAFVESKAQH